MRAPTKALIVRRKDLGGLEVRRSVPVSRILSAFASLARRYGETIIPLGPALLAGSSDLPGDFGRAILSRRTRSRSRGTAGRLPIWPCSVRGFACHRLYSRRGALLPHLFTIACSRCRERQLCVFCATVLRVAPTGRYPAHCPAEFGLSSRLRRPKAT